MRIACASHAADLQDGTFDLAVLPEGTNATELLALASRNSSSIIVGAVSEGSFMRGVAIHAGENRIAYRKIGFDGRSRGSNDISQCPVFHFPDVSVAVLICLDVDDTTVRP